MDCSLKFPHKNWSHLYGIMVQWLLARVIKNNHMSRTIYLYTERRDSNKARHCFTRFVCHCCLCCESEPLLKNKLKREIGSIFDNNSRRQGMTCEDSTLVAGNTYRKKEDYNNRKFYFWGIVKPRHCCECPCSSRGDVFWLEMMQFLPQQWAHTAT